jgi:hypothetical protein
MHQYLERTIDTKWYIQKSTASFSKNLQGPKPRCCGWRWGVLALHCAMGRLQFEDDPENSTARLAGRNHLFLELDLGSMEVVFD